MLLLVYKCLKSDRPSLPQAWWAPESGLEGTVSPDGDGGVGELWSLHPQLIWLLLLTLEWLPLREGCLMYVL